MTRPSIAIETYHVDGEELVLELDILLIVARLRAEQPDAVEAFAQVMQVMLDGREPVGIDA